MFFVLSASIAADYPELREVIERLDGHLAAVGDGGVRADTAADFVDADPAEIERLLKEFERQGVVSSHPSYLCPLCDQLLGTIRDGAGLWCDVCERTQSLRGKDLRGCIMYRVCADASREPLQGVVSISSTEMTGAPILFIAGDRGGGSRAQLDIPGEEQALIQAVKNATRGTLFPFQPPRYAASAAHLIGGVEAGPGILHFAGHGAERRLQLLDPSQPLGVHPIPPERLAELLRHAPKRIRLAYFNTCDSVEVARHLVDAGVVDASIGWAGKINDSHAVQYAGEFYRLACSGRAVEQAMGMATPCLGASPVLPQLFVVAGFERETYTLLRTGG